MNPAAALLFLVFLAACIAETVHAENTHKPPSDIYVFTSNRWPINNAHQATLIFNFDDQLTAEKKLLKGIDKATTLQTAAQMVKSRINRLSDNSIQSIWMGKLMARHWQIKRLPAIVFNKGESVVYGITDINKAIKMRGKYVDQKK